MLQWNSHGTRMRWPELETGANSVSPWTMPRTIAWNEVVAAPLAVRFERTPVRSGPSARKTACYRPGLGLSRLGQNHHTYRQALLVRTLMAIS